MPSSLKLPVTQTGLEQSIQQALKTAGKNSQINLGTNSRQINALAQPLGRITGQADEFTKSMEAANARVFAFGASVGVINSVSKAFSALVKNTIATEKALTDININLGQSSKELDKFGNDLFNLAKNTGQSFETVAQGALELSRQGLDAVDVVKRLNDALILSRLSGLDAQQSVEGLTAAINSFADAGITSEQIVNKLVVVSQKYAVSERDLIEGIKRSASVADQAGVSFDELVGIITTVQERTARGGAVIGNAFKTIFSKIQDKGALEDLQNLGIQVTDAAGKILPATSILQNLSKEFEGLSQIQQTDIAKKLGGVYQLSNLLAAVKDLGSEQSKYAKIVEYSQNASKEAYQKNAALNETLAAIINRVSISAEQLSVTLGNLGITDNMKNLLNFFGGLLDDFQKILGEESAMGGFIRGLAKGLGNLITGPGFALFGAIILKLSKDLVQFGFASLKSFFGIGKAAKDIANVEQSINSALATNIGLQQKLFALEGNRSAQLRVITDALIQQEAVIRRSASISKDLSAPSYQLGVRATSQGLRVPPSAAGGYMPAMQKEASDINRGVGGARSGDRPVTIPNFNFGGGKKGSIVAHTGEYAIPNFAGSGGTAIFNRNMVQKMGLPAGAKKINAAGGLVPNFADLFPSKFGLAGSTVKKEWNQFRETYPNAPLNAFSSSPEVINAYKNWRSSESRSILKTESRESSSLSKLSDTKRNAEFGFIYSGNKPVNENKQVNVEGSSVPVKFLSVVAEPADYLYKEVRKNAIRTAKTYAKNIGIQPDMVDENKFESILNQSLNEGSLQSMVGTIFEAALQGSIGSVSGKSNANFDIPNQAQMNSLSNSFGKLDPNHKNYGLSSALRGLRAGDFKNSLNTDNISSFQGKIARDAINKGTLKTAASGYIPNFANYVYDSDQLTPEQRKTFMMQIMKSPVKKNALLAPAGAGKTTIASKIGPFIKSAADIAKATEFTILSAAARAKDGGLSKPFQEIVSSVAKSGGKMSYLHVPSLEIKNRRSARSIGEGDLRSQAQLKGTRYAPFNQYDFLAKIKKELGPNFEIINGSKGYIPNYVSKSREMGRGVQGAFYRLGEKDGTQVGVKKFFKDGPSKAVEFEWLVSEFISKYANIPSIFGPKNLSSLEDSKRKQSIRKEVVSDPLAKTALGSQVSNAFGNSVLFNALGARGISIGDLHGSNYTVNKNAEDKINELRNYPQDAVGAFSTLRDMASAGAKIGILDPGAAKVSGVARDIIGKILTKQAQQKNAADGFFPNFADPLKAAVGREMAAGVPASQIYIDKNPSLKNAANPMGLMVANRRDEPMGGQQGISRAIKEGRNPKTYGAAGGFVPNYAAGDASAASGGVSKVLVGLFAFQTAVSVLSGFLEEAGDSGKKFAETLQKMAATALIFGTIAFSGPIKNLRELSIASAKLKKDFNQLVVGGGFNQARKAGKETNRFENRSIAEGYSMSFQKFTPISLREKAGYNIGRVQNAVSSSGIGRAASSIGGMATSAGRAIGAGAKFAGGLLGPATIAIGAFKILAEGASGFRTYSNAAAKSLGEMSVYANKATESLSELDRAAIESQSNKSYGYSLGSLIGSLQNIVGISTLASAYTGEKQTNTNFEGRNLQLSNVSEDQFKQTRQSFIGSYVGANRTKFQTAEDAAAQANKDFSSLIGESFNENDVQSLTNQVKELSKEAQKMAKENALAQALEKSGIEAEIAKQDVINFNEVLGTAKKTFLELKEKSFSLQSISNVFKGISEAAIENAYNFSEYDKSIQKLNLSLSEIDASSAIKELNLISETKEKLYSDAKSALGGQTKVLEQTDLKDIFEKIQSEVVSGNISTYDPQKLNRLGMTQQSIKDRSEEFKLQSKELENQTNLEKNNLRIETYRTLVAQQTNAALENQNKNLESQQTKSEKIFEYSEKIRNSQNKIADLKFEKSLVGATQTQRLSAQINRTPELKRRAEQESIINFQQDRIQSVQSLQNLIPSTLSPENQFALKTKIQQSTDEIRSQKTLDQIGSKASQIYAQIAAEINASIQKESTERQGFIISLKDTLTQSTFNFSDSVVSAANEFKKIVIEAAEYPKQQEIKNKINALNEDNVNRRSVLAKLRQELTENAKKTGELQNDPEIGGKEKQQIQKRIDNLIFELEKAQGEIDRLREEPNKPETINNNALQLTPYLSTRPDTNLNSIPSITSFPIADGSASAAKESALLDLESSLQEISNSAENSADELEKLKDPSRILADKFNQLRESIPSNIADLIFQAKSSISGEEIVKANYDIETQRQLSGAKSSDEAAKILRDRQKKSVGQLFNEKFSKTEAEKSLTLKTTLVDASLEFKNNLIDGISQSIEQGQSLGDTLRSAALSFVQTLNKAMMSNAVDSLVGSSKNGSSGILGSVFGYASGGQIVGGSGNKDDVPAMLMGGEFVINKKAAQKYGPDFLNALNSGSISGYAKGGPVQKGPQGNFFTPGQYGLGGISGASNLLDFASQSSTGGSRDRVTNRGRFASLNLEAESGRLTNFGRRTGPAAEALRSAKEEAFNLYIQQYKAKQELRKQEEEQSKAFKNQLMLMGLTLVGGTVVQAGMTGFNNAFDASAKTGLAQYADGFGGIINGGDIGGGNMSGGLKNLFSGNFALANQSEILKAKIISEQGVGTSNISNAIKATGTNNINLSASPALPSKFNLFTPKVQGLNAEGQKMMLDTLNEQYYGDDTSLLPPIGAIQLKATGGAIPPVSGIDTVSTMLSGGEFVMNRAAAQNIGTGNLQALNAGAKSLPTDEKTEQLNDRLLSKLDELIDASGSAGNITINVENSGKSSQSSEGANPEAKQQLARQIRDAVLKVIQEEKRLGGQLRRGM